MFKNGIFLISISLLLSSCNFDREYSEQDDNPTISRNDPGTIEDLKAADRDMARRICKAYINKKEKMETYGDGELTFTFGTYSFGCEESGWNFQGDLAAILRVPAVNNVYFQTRSNLRFIDTIETDVNGYLSFDDFCTKVIKDNTKTHVEINNKLIRYRFLKINGRDTLETGTYQEVQGEYNLSRIETFSVDTNPFSARYGMVLERVQARYCDNGKQTGFKQILK